MIEIYGKSLKHIKNRFFLFDLLVPDAAQKHADTFPHIFLLFLLLNLLFLVIHNFAFFFALPKLNLLFRVPISIILIIAVVVMLLVQMMLVMMMMDHECFSGIMRDLGILDDLLRHYSAIDKYLVIESQHNIFIYFSLNYFLILLDDIDHEYVKSLAAIHRVDYA